MPYIKRQPLPEKIKIEKVYARTQRDYLKGIRSAKRYENHIDIVIEMKASEEKNIKDIIEQLKKAVHKVNRLSESKISYSVEINSHV